MLERNKLLPLGSATDLLRLYSSFEVRRVIMIWSFCPVTFTYISARVNKCLVWSVLWFGQESTATWKNARMFEGIWVWLKWMTVKLKMHKQERESIEVSENIDEYTYYGYW